MSSVDKELPEGWLVINLGEVANVTTGYPFKSIGYSDSGKLRVVRGENVSLKKLRWDNEKYWNNSTENLEQYFLEAYDIVVGMDGSRIGRNKSSISPNELPLILAQRVARIKAKKDYYQGYLKYSILNRFFERYIIKIQTGTSIPHVSLGQIKDFPIIIPSNIEEQKVIANILTAFDDKIELLQQQNQTLETLAQTIFKEWFGKYQLDDELPEGWRVGKFGEVIEFINGYAFKSKELSKEPIDNAYKVFKMGDIKKGGGFNPSKTKGYFPKSSSNKLKKYILKNGDLLMSMTDMKDAISLLGHTALMIYDDEYIVNQRVGLIRAQNDVNIDYPYLYLLTNNDDFIANLRAGANSGVQVNLSTQGIKDTEFIIADKETNKAFNNAVMPLFEKRKANSLMIKELKKTRDTLLPKLMSGQVRVKM